MQTNTQPNHIHNLKYGISTKEQGKYASIFNKRKLDQMFTARRVSSFATAHDFFQNNSAFMPNSAALSPDKDKAAQERKEKFKLYRNMKLPDLDSFSRLIRWQPQTKNNSQSNSSKVKQYTASARHETISFFRTTSVTPSKRSYKVRRVPQITQKTQLQSEQLQSMNVGETVGKMGTMKGRSYRLKQRFNDRSYDADGQSVSGWDMKPLFQGQVQVL